MIENEKQSESKRKHNLILKERNSLIVSGVRDVSEFDDIKVIITTEAGDLTVEGEKLHINNFSQESGELDMNGRINTLIYNEPSAKDGSFFSKLFR